MTHERARVSATVIAFNEEQDLAECLASLSWCDEIVLVDSGSTDRTREIAGRYGARVLVRQFAGFSDQKNFAAAEAHHDWILSIDADESVSEELREEILHRLPMENSVAGFFIPRRNLWLGVPIRHGGWWPDQTVRLYRRSAARWVGISHEAVVVEGRVAALRHPIVHKSLRDIHDHLRKGLCSSVLELQEARSRELRLCWLPPLGLYAACVREFFSGRPTLLRARMIYKARLKNKVDLVWLLPFHPLLRFLYMYVVRAGFLDGAAGFWVAYTSAVVEAMKMLRIWEHFVFQRGRAARPEESLEDPARLYRSIS
ncbi:MAG TPA: glycosyltransferase family 2 protein [Candidatus Acidoferrales bacterium]|nr:glycosyltransferase family 2 protein [Candidatus Acidoferrales bacterium]